ncbi:MAG: PAS domain S-box protein, partial [bacterium]
MGNELQGVGRDITERREAESKANAILKAIPDLMFIFDKQGKYLECHTKDESLLIYPSDEIIDKNIEDVFDDEELINFSKEMIKKTLNYQKLHTVEYNLSIGGVVKTFEARLVPLDNKVMSIVRDITDKKTAEKRLKKYFEEINNKNQLL